MLSDGTWVIAELENGKRRLARIMSVSHDEVQVHFDGDADDENGAIRPGDILAALGPDPQPGMAYGVRVEPLHETHPGSGLVQDVYIRRKLDDTQREVLMGCIKTALKAVRTFKLQGLFDLVVRPYTGRRVVGKFINSAKGQRIEIIPADEDFGAGPSEIVRLLLHEIGHKHWSETLGRRARMDWVKSFQAEVTGVQADAEELAGLFEELVGCETVKEAVKLLQPDRRAFFKKVLAYIKDNSLTGAESIDGTLEITDLKDYWPDKVSWGEYTLSVSDYGNKNPVEDFCECYSYHVLGLPLDEHNERRIKAAMRS